MAIERLLSGSIQERIEELLRPEDLIMEAARDLVKDEIKGYIKQKIDDTPELKEELKETIQNYFEAKARSAFAEVKASRSALKLGMNLLPEEMQQEFAELVMNMFEKELGELLERAL
ncbi:MAG: hypothetical protein CMB56_000745 [Methanobacteriota archaeon]|nr:MAG: hypothetical protein CMB56_000745 [Euryarchaeota archaeon]